ncbi:15302_t:CDS:2 [Racocetra fulgida]|uniref:15302_t:CDS:1 n=1 Tax=Racocetra fulgida TaxID=60492 RepID=A0A9N8VXJ3_9GLOM|nr:15302_t:CDS:2 [Racocetra fulgida]
MQDEFENSSESSGSNIAEGSNTNIVEGSNTNTDEGPNTMKVYEILFRVLKVINLMSEDDTDNEAEADPIHEYKADSDNDNQATFNSESKDDYYKAEEINYINDWA